MEEAGPAVEQKPVNPLLQRIQMPGETFTLPSGGLFYDEGILDPSVKNAEIHVHPMTTLDEITMKTPDLLFSGNAVRQVFARCIPQVLDPNRLLTKDVDFLLTCLRKVSYGDAMKIEYTHTCKDAKRHSYEANVSGFIRAAKRIDPTTVTKDFTVTFPNGQVAKLQPVTFTEFVRIMQTLNAQQQDESPERLKDEVLSSTAGLIVSVDTITDKAMIREWLEQLSPQFIAMINETIEKASGWGTDFDVHTKCKDCGEDITISAPMNPLAFFT